MRAVKIPRVEGGGIGPTTESCLNWDGPIAIEPCLHQGNIYTKRKIRVWRDQKCIPLVGAKTILICAGRQNTPSRGRQCKAQNGRLRQLGWTYRHGTVFGPRQYLYQKEATGMERPEMFSTISVQKPYLPVLAVKVPRLEGGSIGPRTESYVNYDGPIAMVPVFEPRQYRYQ